MEKPSTPGLVAKGAVLLGVTLLVIYPFVGVLGTSLSDEVQIARSGGFVLLPTDPTFDAYRAIFDGGTVTRALLISVLVTAAGTLASVCATIGMAYGLSRREVTGSRIILMVALFTMLFNPGIIANFLLVKELGLLNTFGALVLPSLVSAFNLVVLRSFFMGLPGELLESARMDGAGDLRILVRIVLPLSKAVLAVVSLFYAVAYWNAFFNALLYLDDTEKWPLPLILRSFVLQGRTLESIASSEAPAPVQAIQMAVLVVAIVPILLVYPFLQRYFTKGVLTGAIKG
ncbi:carbohydrate ABC transporter permease [Nonomuraea soli]|uniref:Putative aldouronate transport system permease protein n=1 Tax=Nonomuraea soli TaxID=1032476 RepID=A0A7W0HUC1_9ACTN|nr:carbohydrate ABC transporter permease [Nonomuraea soli]MBA2895807.1 putative aldouronate transport system permease protein [Nonomuraea soli]